MLAGPVALAALLAVCTPGCVTSRGGAVQDWVMRDRLRAVEVGQSADAVHALLGGDPVERPGHPDDPFPSPLHELALTTPAGERVRVEVYVVATRSAPGCPDVHYEDTPVAYVDGVVAGKTWEFVEWHWREWGGALADLRAAQDRFHCPEPSPAEAAPPAAAEAP